MEIFVLAISLVSSFCSFIVNMILLSKLKQMGKSVPDKQESNKVASPVAKREIPKGDPKDKWEGLKGAFNLSGKSNGRSGTQ